MKYCTSKEFYVSVDEKTNKKLLRLNSNGGFELVLFYSEKCPHCYDYLKSFGECNDNAANVTFTLVNIDQSRDIIQSSKGTTTELTQVPFVVLYVNGTAYMSYSGPPVANEILGFCKDVSIHYIEAQKNTPAETPGDKAGPSSSGGGETAPPKNSCDAGDKACEAYKPNHQYCLMSDAYIDKTGAL